MQFPNGTNICVTLKKNVWNKNLFHFNVWQSFLFWNTYIHLLKLIEWFGRHLPVLEAFWNDQSIIRVYNLSDTYLTIIDPRSLICAKKSSVTNVLSLFLSVSKMLLLSVSLFFSRKLSALQITWKQQLYTCRSNLLREHRSTCSHMKIHINILPRPNQTLLELLELMYFTFLYYILACAGLLWTLQDCVEVDLLG